MFTYERGIAHENNRCWCGGPARHRRDQLGPGRLLGLNPIAGTFGGDAAAFTRLVYVAVGSAALYQVVNLRRIQERWGVDMGPV